MGLSALVIAGALLVCVLLVVPRCWLERLETRECEQEGDDVGSGDPRNVNSYARVRSDKGAPTKPPPLTKQASKSKAMGHSNPPLRKAVSGKAFAGVQSSLTRVSSSLREARPGAADNKMRRSMTFKA